MTTTARVRYDGQSLILENSVDLDINARYEIKITPIIDSASEADETNNHSKPPTEQLHGLLKLADALNRLPQNPDAPRDLAAQHDHYLYGTPKRPNP